jgi:hypothetical protein
MLTHNELFYVCSLRRVYVAENNLRTRASYMRSSGDNLKTAEIASRSTYDSSSLLDVILRFYSNLGTKHSTMLPDVSG